jgi:organic hydroperoxide reductase OsmC/OhrA
MQNLTKVTTLWMLAGYYAPLTAEHFAESSSYANTVVSEFADNADHKAVEAWLTDDLIAQAAAVCFMQNYWHVTFNAGAESSLRSAPHVPPAYTHALMAIVNSVSAMP